MSGICAIFYTDEQAVTGAELELLIASLAFRGPDGQAVWRQGSVGLGLTYFAIAPEKPESLIPEQDGIALVFDGRLDDRATLHSRLRTLKLPLGETPSDPDLFLAAYRAWGEDCVDYLLGDFAFALWDEPAAKLWCGHDAFGVRPLYFAQRHNCLLVSNTLRTLHQHPSRSRILNEAAIADFLLFGFNHNPHTTTFRDIQRLPGGHTLRCTRQGLRLHRYWTLPVPEMRRYRQPQDYVVEFQHQVDTAVRDRVRCPQVSIFFSGGLDSTTLAATALDVCPSLNLPGFTVVYDHLIPDDERTYAMAAAQALSLPLTCFAADEAKLCAPTSPTPEPSLQVFPEISQAQYRWAAHQSRVVLYGQGADEGLRLSTVSQVLGQLPWWQLGRDLWLSRTQYQCWPHWGTGLWAQWRRWRQPPDPWWHYPPWLDRAFEQRNQTRDRWLEIRCASAQHPSCPHPWRPRAYRSLLQPLWPLNFEAVDPGVQGEAVRVVFPYLDLRLVNYLLSLPPFPWFIDKTLSRVALQQREHQPQRHTLPALIYERPKTPLRADPVQAWLARGANPWATTEWEGAIAQFVTVEQLNTLHPSTVPSHQRGPALRPLFLQRWLRDEWGRQPS